MSYVFLNSYVIPMYLGSASNCIRFSAYCRVHIEIKIQIKIVGHKSVVCKLIGTGETKKYHNSFPF